MQDGSLELCRDGERLYLYCDTPGVKLRLPGLVAASGALHLVDGTTRPLGRLGDVFQWPYGAALLEVSVGQ